jgi:hypothetical protein
MFRSHHSPQSRLFGLAWKSLELGVKGTDLGERSRLFISIVDKVELGLLLQSARTLDLGPVPRISALYILTRRTIGCPLRIWRTPDRPSSG